MTRKERTQMYAGTLFLDQRPSDATADTIEKAFLHWLSKRYDGVQPVFYLSFNSGSWFVDQERNSTDGTSRTWVNNRGDELNLFYFDKEPDLISPHFDKGALYNLSDQQDYDRFFLNHALSRARYYLRMVRESLSLHPDLQKEALF